MKNQEFSDSFDTLLNSYNSQAQFGDEASRQEIVLDEYEKSVILTQAQDITLKSFFDRKQNSVGDGFDDSTRRQVDFSSLIKTETLVPADDSDTAFDERGIIYNMPLRKYPVEYPDEYYTESEAKAYNAGLEGAVKVGDLKTPGHSATESEINDHNEFIGYWTTGSTVKIPGSGEIGDSDYVAPVYYSEEEVNEHNSQLWDGTTPHFIEPVYYTQEDADEFNAALPGAVSTSDVKTPAHTEWEAKEGSTDVLFILNEQLKTKVGEAPAKGEADTRRTKSYVVVPINYREYDREMTKAYAQPLKKQVWRLFQNNTQGFDIKSELIPNVNLENNETIESYKIRYIRRPCPIVLVDLPNGLEIDGFTNAQECELNPILHPEILQKALEIAISTRGGVPASRTRENSNNQ